METRNNKPYSFRICIKDIVVLKLRGYNIAEMIRAFVKKTAARPEICPTCGRPK